MDEEFLPDPLNDSPTFQSPQKTRRVSRARWSLPPQTSSPTKQTFELDVGSEVSPQKLIVTVEAGSDAAPTYNGLNRQRSISPTRPMLNRRRERTITTTIPVKGLSDSDGDVQDAPTPKRGRGRPRKSAGTPIKKGRSSTPAGKNTGRRKSIGDLIDGDDEQDIDFHIGKSVEIRRGKGKSRSRSLKGTSRKSTPGPQAVEAESSMSSASRKKGRGRRKTLVAEEVLVLEDPESPPREMDNGGNESQALQSVHGNTPSAYSTIRSTTTIGWGEPDVIARFGAENETPRKSGWSSPRIVEGRSSPARCLNNKFPSPERSFNQPSGNQNYRHSVDLIPAPSSAGRVPSTTQDLYEDNVNTQEEEDGFGELVEFDTILESEGFSMISVDSVQSLKVHRSSPASYVETDHETASSNKSVCSGTNAHIGENVFPPGFRDPSTNATPNQRLQTQGLLSVPPSRANDSFSSLPPEILEAATPAPKTQVSRLRVTNARVDDSFSSIAPDILEAATPARALAKRSALTPIPLPSEAYEDSFSAIPAAVLDAATPAAKRVLSFKPQPVPGSKVATESVSNGPQSQRAASRLLTPDETPSPGDLSAEAAGTVEQAIKHHLPGISATQTSDQDSLIHSHMPSSPPAAVPRRYTYTAHLRRCSQLQPRIAQTPSIVFSSPTLPPPINVPRAGNNAVSGAYQERPAMSPVARVGQALQNIIVPGSPRARSFSLGSPFKSPAAERKPLSGDSADIFPSPSQERGIKNLPRMDLSSNLSTTAPKKQDSVRSTLDDPFSNHQTLRRSPSPDADKPYSLGLPENRQLSDPSLGAVQPAESQLLSTDEMSWQAEDEVSVARQTSSLVVGKGFEGTDLPPGQRLPDDRGRSSLQNNSNQTSKVISIASDTERSEEEEDFGLLIETINSSSPVPAAAPEQEPSKEVFDKPRRSKIPSPWRKNSRRLIYNDEITQFSSPMISPKPSLANGLRKTNHTQDTATVRRIETPEFQVSDDVDPNISNWRIPQKSSFNPRPKASGDLDLSLLLGNSPAKRLPVLSSMSSKPSGEQHSLSDRLSSNKMSTGTHEGMIEADASEIDPFGPIPQKAGFHPRPRESSVKANDSLGIFSQIQKPGLVSPFDELTSSAASQERTPLSPSRAKTLNRKQTAPAHLEDSEVGFDEDSRYLSPRTHNNENDDLHSRTLKWTQTVVVSPNVPTPGPTIVPPSPTKSCLRSPVKTSSAFSAATPNKNVQFVSSSPVPSESEEPLSATEWTKDHWRLLDSMWRSHMKVEGTTPTEMLRGSTNPGVPASTPVAKSGSADGEGKRRRNSTRVISKLLGRHVTIKKEKMKLQQWHLEVVDEFRERVPGWEEKVVALRFFALVVGADRRSRGLMTADD